MRAKPTEAMEKKMKSLSTKPVKVFAAVLAAVVTAAVFGSFEIVEYTEMSRMQDAAARAEPANHTVKLAPIVVTSSRAV
jgi:hypothetical protein